MAEWLPVSAIDSKSEPSWVRDFISLSDVEFNSKNNGALGFSIGIFVNFLKNILFFCFFFNFLIYFYGSDIILHVSWNLRGHYQYCGILVKCY